MNRYTRHILELLKKADHPISGEKISGQLGISRAAVWKHIQALRAADYVIDSAPNRGYRLVQCPDSLLSCEVQTLLQTRTLGRTYKFVDSTESTNRLAGRMAADGAPEGTVITADRQTAGRGRLGRTWFSPAGRNIYASIVLRPPVPPLQATQLSLIMALAVARVLRQPPFELPVLIKWPNDLFLAGRKLGGILCDMETEPEQVHYLVAGLGLNVNIEQDELPKEIADSAVSLRLATGKEQDRARLLAAILNQLEIAYDDWLAHGLKPLLAELDRVSFLQGRKVTVEVGGRHVTGTVTGMADNGALRMEQPNGEEKTILAGDVHVEKY